MNPARQGPPSYQISPLGCPRSTPKGHSMGQGWPPHALKVSRVWLAFGAVVRIAKHAPQGGELGTQRGDPRSGPGRTGNGREWVEGLPEGLGPRRSSGEWCRMLVVPGWKRRSPGIRRWRGCSAARPRLSRPATGLPTRARPKRPARRFACRPGALHSSPNVRSARGWTWIRAQDRLRAAVSGKPREHTGPFTPSTEVTLPNELAAESVALFLQGRKGGPHSST